MKKAILTMILAVLCIGAYAQSDPNRMIIQPKGWAAPIGFDLAKIDSLYFERIDGEIKADVEFMKYAEGKGEDSDTVTLAVTRSASCESFGLTVVPTVTAGQITDDNAADYFTQMAPDKYYQDFTEGVLTGYKFKDNTSYTIVTVGYDIFGVAGQVCKAEFTTPRKQLVGTPNVEWEITETTANSFTIKFTPNADCKGFGICAFKKGEAQSQFDMFGPMMGFANMGDMIMRFSGSTYTEVLENQWDDMNPGTEHEVYVQPIDANGTYADMIIIPVATKPLGGDGPASVTIEIGKFEYYAEGNGYLQQIIFTPNDQTANYHTLILDKSYYGKDDWTEDGIKEYLMGDTDKYNPFNPYWDNFDVDDAQWNVDPGTTYLAMAMAKNAKGEWSELITKEFTTPTATQAPMMAPAKQATAKKYMAPKKVITKGTTKIGLKPGMANAKAGIRLQAK